jgi:hypothetical protein
MIAALLDILFPQPVLVRLGDASYKAGPLTLGDMAVLQSWLRMAADHPLDDLPPAPLDRTPGTRRARLLAAWQAAKSWPPVVGSGDEGPWLDTPEGRAVFLVLVLGRYDDTFKAENAESLAASMTPEDWARLRRIAWGKPVWRELAAELDPVWRQAQEDGAGDAGWSAAIVSVMRHGHYDYDQIAEWTPAQLALYCSEGKVAEYRAIRRPDESREAFEERVKGTFSP